MYSSYAVRLESLKNWPGRRWVDIDEAAHAGLYYLGYIRDDEGSRDRLRCAFCEFIVGNWKRGDNVWKMHAASEPTCQHLLFCKGIEFVKEVLQEEESNAEFQVTTYVTDRSMYGHVLRSQDLTVLGISGYLLRRQQSTSISGSTGFATIYTSRGVPFTAPKNMDMVHPETRLASFDKMDLLCKTLLDLTAVAEAGFFFTGYGDSVRCYHCDGGFKNWNRTDNPWVEHARHAPHCMHVILTKGEEFVERVLRDIHGEMKRYIPVTNTDKRKRELDSDTEEKEIDGNVKKKLKVYGVSEKEGEERHRPEDTELFPTTVTPARRTQRCRSCRTSIQEQWDKQEANLQLLGNSIRVHEPSYQLCASSSNPPQICTMCHRRKDAPSCTGSICCRVSVCEPCGKRNEQCPICGRT